MKIRTNSTRFIVNTSLATGLLIASSLGAGAQSVTIGTADPSQGNAAPFGLSFGSDYEQVYNQTDFSGPIDISQITYFNTQHPSFASSQWSTATYSFYLSTASVGVDELTGGPGDIGPNSQFFGSFSLSSLEPKGAIPFDGTEFEYDPSQGNLLLNIVVTGRSSQGNASLDAMNGDAGDLFSRYDNNPFFTHPGSMDGYGLVTEFANAPVPDAVPAWLLLSGACLILHLARRSQY